MKSDTNVETIPAPPEQKDRIDGRFIPNKANGTAGKWIPIIIRDFSTIDPANIGATVEEDMRRSHERSYTGNKDDMSAKAKAISDGFSLWPHVRLSEEERIANADARLDGWYERKRKAIRLKEQQRTRAYLLCDAEDGLSADDALKRIEAEDKEAAKNEAADAPKDAPTVDAPTIVEVDTGADDDDDDDDDGIIFADDE